MMPKDYNEAILIIKSLRVKCLVFFVLGIAVGFFTSIGFIF